MGNEGIVIDLYDVREKPWEGRSNIDKLHAAVFLVTKSYGGLWVGVIILKMGITREGDP